MSSSDGQENHNDANKLNENTDNLNWSMLNKQSSSILENNLRKRTQEKERKKKKRKKNRRTRKKTKSRTRRRKKAEELNEQGNK